MKQPFNIWLQNQIKNKGFTQRAYAQRLGVDESTISGYLSGRRTPNTRMLIRIVLSLGDKRAGFIAALEALEVTYRSKENVIE
ncbi:MAG: hypothetical protein CMC15_15340 [Flavobacteriaceae bacterium]|nr:hypothetical protein [Flavobacteriaceae bacterium]